MMTTPKDNPPSYHPGITMHKIPVEGAVGLLFVFATVFIFGVGIPAVRWLLVISGTFGMLGSGLLLYWHRRHALKIQSLDMHKPEYRGSASDDTASRTKKPQ